jgi:hypothetical protein
MNIVELHERVRFWLDFVGSARFEASDIDNALNVALNDIVEQKYEGSRANTKGDSFQRTQKIRDELSKIVKMSDSSVGGSITLTNSTGFSLIPVASFPTDYKYLLAIALYNTAGTKYNCWPLTYDRINIIDSNPFRKPRLGPIPKQYYIESNLGIKMLHVIVPAPDKVVIYYLARPVQFHYGLEYTSTHTFTAGQKFIVVSESAVYGGTTYLRGTEVTIVAPILTISSGTVVQGYTDSDINENLHEEIARKAAINALISIKDLDRSKSLYVYFQ